MGQKMEMNPKNVPTYCLSDNLFRSTASFKKIAYSTAL